MRTRTADLYLSPVTDYSHGHCERTPLIAGYLIIMTLLQNITGGNRSTLFAVVLRPDLSRDGSQSHVVPTTLNQWSDIYPGVTSGLERDTE